MADAARTVRMSGFGEFFATRYRAREVAAFIPQRPILDFTGVVAVARPFADELWVHLPEGAELVGMNTEVAETFRLVGERRSSVTPAVGGHPNEAPAAGVCRCGADGSGPSDNRCVCGAGS